MWRAGSGTLRKEREKIAIDKTFGLKNKNKSKASLFRQLHGTIYLDTNLFFSLLIVF